MVATLNDFETSSVPDLAQRMIKLADEGRHERAVELFARAGELTRAVQNHNTSPPLLLATWARARRLWCDLTGEDLV